MLNTSNGQDIYKTKKTKKTLLELAFAHLINFYTLIFEHNHLLQKSKSTFYLIMSCTSFIQK